MTGPELADARRRLGLTQEALARAFGYSHRNKHAAVMFISRIERGERPIKPEWPILLDLFERHGVP